MKRRRRKREQKVEAQAPQCVLELVKYRARCQNPFRFYESGIRNVMFVGPTRAGKTTAMRLLRDPAAFPPLASLFSDTHDPSYTTSTFMYRPIPGFPKLDPKDAARYSKPVCIRIVDTPGLFEVRNPDEDQESRSEKDILRVIGECMENEIRQVHAVVMFASLTAGLVKEEMDAIKLFARLFSTAHNADDSEGAGQRSHLRMALCITRTEELSDDRLADLKKDIEAHPGVASVIKEHNIEILFLGSAAPEDKMYTDLSLFSTMVRTYDRRTHFLRYLIDSEDPVKLWDLNIVDAQRSLLKDLLRELIETWSLLLETPFADWGDVSKEEHAKRAENVNKNRGYFSCDGVAGVFSDAFERAGQLWDRNDVPLPERLFWCKPFDFQSEDEIVEEAVRAAADAAADEAAPDAASPAAAE